MKKCLLFIFIFGITISLYNIEVKANDDLSKELKQSRSIYTLDPNNYSNVYFVEGFSSSWYDGAQPVIICTGQNPTGFFNSDSTSENLKADFGFSLVNVNIDDFEVNSSYGTQTTRINMYNIMRIIVYKGSFDFGNYETVYDSYESWEDYEESLNPPPPEPTWWEAVYDELLRQLGLTEGGMLYPVVELWNWLFPDDEIIDQGDIELVEPPSPTPFPTSIPYSTTIDPTTGIIYYHYNGITATAPPPEPTYVITLPPDPGIAMPSGVVYPDEGLQNVIDSIDDNIIEYQSGIETVRDSFSTLPIKWFAFFGIPAAIILIAGVIKSLLG